MPRRIQGLSEPSGQGSGLQEPCSDFTLTVSTFVSSRPASAIKNLHGCAGMPCQLPGIQLWMHGEGENQAKPEDSQANLRFTDPLHDPPPGSKSTGPGMGT